MNHILAKGKPKEEILNFRILDNSNKSIICDRKPTIMFRSLERNIEFGCQKSQSSVVTLVHLHKENL